MEELKFRLRDGEKELIKKAKGKLTYREFILSAAKIEDGKQKKQKTRARAGS